MHRIIIFLITFLLVWLPASQVRASVKAKIASAEVRKNSTTLDTTRPPRNQVFITFNRPLTDSDSIPVEHTLLHLMDQKVMLYKYAVDFKLSSPSLHRSDSQFGHRDVDQKFMTDERRSLMLMDDICSQNEKLCEAVNKGSSISLTAWLYYREKNDVMREGELLQTFEKTDL